MCVACIAVSGFARSEACIETKLLVGLRSDRNRDHAQKARVHVLVMAESQEFTMLEDENECEQVLAGDPEISGTVLGHYSELQKALQIQGGCGFSATRKGGTDRDSLAMSFEPDEKGRLLRPG